MFRFFKKISFVIFLFYIYSYSYSSDLIKTKCYKTENPIGEVCLFEDKKALGENSSKYKDSCEENSKLPVKNLKKYELQTTDINNNEIDRQYLSPLTSLNLLKIKVNGIKTFTTSYENSACSIWRGSVESPFWVINGKIIYFTINDKRVVFTKTLKRSWIPVSDGFLEAYSEYSPDRGNPKIDGGWITVYKRYQFINNVWAVKEKLNFAHTEFENEVNEIYFPERVKN
jgi:hypothetical protein